MIYSLTGKLKHIDLSFLVIECGGVGFKCAASANTIKNIGDIGDTVSIYTYLAVREDALELYGFIDEAEQDCYLKLTSVSGVGPKAAIAILSVLTPNALANAVVTGNEKAITAAQGVGTKVAQRIILELKSKFTATQGADDRGNSVSALSLSENNNLSEAVIALEALGYVHGQATSAIKGIDPNLPVNTIIKLALKNLM